MTHDQEIDALIAKWRGKSEYYKDYQSNAAAVFDLCADELEALQAANREPVCSCPSGDGSLRWPCQAHPPEAMAKDAERYRFLRDTQATIIYKRNAAGGTWEPLIDTRETSTRCGSLDEATDKAMAEATTPRGG